MENTSLYYNYIYKLSDRNAENEKVYKTTQVAEEYIGNDVYIYDYDVLGNITSIRKAERKSTDETKADFKEYKNDVDYVTYAYDDLGQLTEENFSNDRNKNTWKYDELGNVTKKVNNLTRRITNPITNVTHEDEKTTTLWYNYGVDPDSDNDGKSEAGWKNLLTSVTTTKALDGIELFSETEYIDYDAIGNPTTYLGATLTWNGRQLTSYSKDDISISYKYDANGLRNYKKIGSVTSKYFYVNGLLHYEERSDGKKLYYFYDSNGYLSGIEYNDITYYPATTLNGDVVAIYNNLGECLAKYEYDAWGNVLSVKNASGNDITDPTHIANINPIRYRGYYYDTETKWYYLQSRYYNPEVGRFLNADGYITTGQGVLSYNMFAYCGNNPVMYSDPSGCGLIAALLGGIALVGMLVLSSCTKTTKTNNSTPSTQSTTQRRSNSKGSYTDFTNAIGAKESSNNYQAKNQYGYLGRYQMGTSALQDAGFKDSSGAWNSTANSYGVYSDVDFLNNPTCQDAAIKNYHTKVCGYIRSYGMDSYIGTMYCGVEVTQSGLLAACHLVGVGEMNTALANGAVVWDANGTEASEYMNSFGGYDISGVW